jgi:putative ABC transport system permease protein
MGTRLLQGLLFGVTALDAATFAGVAIAFLAVAALASFVPARRAMRVDPVVALRHE